MEKKKVALITAEFFMEFDLLSKMDFVMVKSVNIFVIRNVIAEIIF